MRKKKKIKKGRIVFFLFMVLIGVIISYQKLEKSKLEITNKDFVNLITEKTFKEESIIETLAKKTIEVSNPIKALNQNYQKYITTLPDNPKEEEPKVPILYFYNTHSTEEYSPSTYAEFSINPTVIMNNYILQDFFEKKGYASIVEESSISEILKTNHWNYASSYKASRILIEDAKNKYPSLEYFVDIHRDSLAKEKTSTIIDDKEYARILFIIGMENPNYSENLQFTEKINQKIEEYYPGLSKGIYKKSGAGVNGIYNQDFSPHTILIEIGGFENTTTEVLNSSLAFARCLWEVIHE